MLYKRLTSILENSMGWQARGLTNWSASKKRSVRKWFLSCKRLRILKDSLKHSRLTNIPNCKTYLSSRRVLTFISPSWTLILVLSSRNLKLTSWEQKSSKTGTQSLINYKYLCALFQKYYVSSCSDVETAYRQIQDYETFISLAFKCICEYWRRKLRSMEKKTTGFWRIWTFDFKYIHIQQITHCDSWIWAASNI